LMLAGLSFLGVEVDQEDQVGRVVLEGRLNRVMNLGVGMDGTAAFDRHPFGFGAGAPWTGRGGRITHQTAGGASLQMKVVCGAMLEVRQVLDVEIVDVERHAEIVGLDSHRAVPLLSRAASPWPNRYRDSPSPDWRSARSS